MPQNFYITSMTKDALRKELGIIGELSSLEAKGEHYDVTFIISYLEDIEPMLAVRYFMDDDINELSVTQTKSETHYLENVNSIEELKDVIYRNIIDLKIDKFKLTRKDLNTLNT